MTKATEALRLAESLLESRRLSQAARALDHAESLGASQDQCSSGRWLAAMLRGDFSAAWRESDAIRARGVYDPNRFWQGEDIRGKRVIVRCLHGFGDAVQFLRYAPMLCRMASRVIFEVPPAMLEIARCFDGVDEAITWGEHAPANSPQWDVQIEVIELPYVLRTRAEDLPLATKYLRIPEHVRHAVAPQPRTPGSVNVGLVWACGEWNPVRSVPLEVLRPLTRMRGFEFWNLQGSASRDQWSVLGNCPALHDAQSSSDTVLKLAALTAELDLIITPDTLAAHLAGALGKPAWVMLEHACDWRWMHARSDTPWYPSLRLFRQPRAGDWTAVARELQSAMASLIRDKVEPVLERLVA